MTKVRSPWTKNHKPATTQRRSATGSQYVVIGFLFKVRHNMLMKQMKEILNQKTVGLILGSEIFCCALFALFLTVLVLLFLSPDVLVVCLFSLLFSLLLSLLLVLVRGGGVLLFLLLLLLLLLLHCILHLFLVVVVLVVVVVLPLVQLITAPPPPQPHPHPHHYLTASSSFVFPSLASVSLSPSSSLVVL